MRSGYIQTSIAVSVAGGILAIFAWTSQQFDNITTHTLDSDQRIAKLEEAVTTIKGDTGEIKGDIKSILKAVR